MSARGRSQTRSEPLSRSLSRDSECSLLSSSSSFSLSPPRTSERSQPASIIVKGISRNVLPEHLRDIFSQYGYIQEISIKSDREYKSTSLQLILGSAIIEFSSAKAAGLAVDCMDDGQIDGMDVVVRIFDSRTTTSRDESPSSSSRAGSAAPGVPRHRRWENGHRHRQS